MKYLVLAALSLAVPLVGPAPCRAQEDVHAPGARSRGASEASFLELEWEWTDALARHDRDRLESLLHADFTLLSAGATSVVERARYLENSMAFEWPRREVRIIDVRQEEEVAVIRCVWRGTEPPPFPIPEPEGGVYAFLLTDVWLRGDGGWQVLARHSSFIADARLEPDRE